MHVRRRGSAMTRQKTEDAEPAHTAWQPSLCFMVPDKRPTTEDVKLCAGAAQQGAAGLPDPGVAAGVQTVPEPLPGIAPVGRPIQKDAVHLQVWPHLLPAPFFFFSKSESVVFDWVTPLIGAHQPS